MWNSSAIGAFYSNIEWYAMRESVRRTRQNVGNGIKFLTAIGKG